MRWSKFPYWLRGAFIVALITIGLYLLVPSAQSLFCAGRNCYFMSLLSPLYYAGAMMAWGIGGDKYASDFTFGLAAWIYTLAICFAIGALIGRRYGRLRRPGAPREKKSRSS